jgi:hypothetical protein
MPTPEDYFPDDYFPDYYAAFGTPAPLYLNYGRLPIGRAQWTSGDYPLLDPQDDVEHLLADAYLWYEDPADYDAAETPFVGPFELAWLYGFGDLPADPPEYAPAPAHLLDVLVRDATGRTVFDTTTATDFATRAWGTRLRIHEWRAEGRILRLVQHTAWPPEGAAPEERAYGFHIAPEDGRLNPMAVLRAPKRLRALVVGDVTCRGPVELVGGYNTRVAAPSEVVIPGLPSAGVRPRLQASIAIEPGAGEGRYPSCEDEQPPRSVLTVNGVGPDAAGDVRLEAAGCYRVGLPGEPSGGVFAVVSPHTLEVSNDCDPCCDCDAYVEMKLAIDAVYAKLQQAAAALLAAKDQYALAREDWLAEAACRAGQPSGRLTVEGACAGFFGGSLVFCAKNRECGGPLEVSIEVSAGRFVGAYTRRNDPPERPGLYRSGDSGPSMTLSWDRLDNRTPAVLLFVAQGCDESGAAATSITVTATLTYGDEEPLVLTVTANEPEDCPEACGEGS